MIETIHSRSDGKKFPTRIIATPERGRSSRIVLALEDMTAVKERRTEAEAIDHERRRIAQEIHDGVAQDLASLRLKLSIWEDWIKSNPKIMLEELNDAREILDQAIEEIRRSIFSLRPLALDEIGLLPALDRYIADFNDQHQLFTTLVIEGAQENLPVELELTLFRVVQESLNNIIKHSQATFAWVTLEISPDQEVRLEIRDNGCGLNLVNLTQAVRLGHFGLKQMTERVEKQGGSLRMETSPGEGVTIEVYFKSDPSFMR